MIEIIPNWHPVFVHFTVALLSVAGALFLVSFLAKGWQHRQTALLIAEWNFWIGSLLTIATVLAGWYAYNTVNHDTPSHAAMTIHRNWAFATLAVIAVIAIWIGLAKKRGGLNISIAFIVPVVVLLGLLGTTAWHGGEVVYRYGVGVMSMPKSTGDGHDHDHGDGQGHDAMDSKQNKADSHHDPIDGGHGHDDSEHKH